MNKLELIKEFYKYHPVYGVDWGYSRYIGGMTDSGEWLAEVLMNESEQALKVRLDILERKQAVADEQNRERIKEYERVQSLSKEEQNEYYLNQRKKINEEFKKIFEKHENFLMWGKPRL